MRTSVITHKDGPAANAELSGKMKPRRAETKTDAPGGREKT